MNFLSRMNTNNGFLTSKMASATSVPGTGIQARVILHHVYGRVPKEPSQRPLSMSIKPCHR